MNAPDTLAMAGFSMIVVFIWLATAVVPGIIRL